MQVAYLPLLPMRVLMRNGCSPSVYYCTVLCSGVRIYFPRDLKILRKKSWNCLISGEWTNAASWKKQKCLHGAAGCSKLSMTYETPFLARESKERLQQLAVQDHKKIDKLWTIPWRLMGLGAGSPCRERQNKTPSSENPPPLLCGRSNTGRGSISRCSHLPSCHKGVQKEVVF